VATTWSDPALAYAEHWHRTTPAVPERTLRHTQATD